MKPKPGASDEEDLSDTSSVDEDVKQRNERRIARERNAEREAALQTSQVRSGGTNKTQEIIQAAIQEGIRNRGNESGSGGDPQSTITSAEERTQDVPSDIRMDNDREEEEDISTYSQEQVEDRIALETTKLGEATKKARRNLQEAAEALRVAAATERKFIRANLDVDDLEKENEQTRVAAATAVPPSMLTPGQAMTGVLDYKTSEHRKFFEKATRKLMPEHELFDINPEKIQDFIDLLSSRCADNNWSETINKIKVEDTPDSPRIPLLTNYGLVTLEQVRMHEMAYIASGTRSAQNTKMMYNCIYSSLSQEGRSKIASDRHKYVLNIGGNAYESGNLLFKTVVDKSVLSTNGLARHLHGQISKLNEYLIEVKYDIVKLHAHVNEIELKLQSIGQKPYDLKRHLIHAYREVKGTEFEHYVMRIGDKVDEANLYNGKELTPKMLMEIVQNKYNSMVLAKTWNVPTSDKEEIMALKSTVKMVKKQLASARRGKPKGRPTRGPRGHPKNRDKMNSEAKFNALKRTKPEDPKNDVLMHNGKKFQWCGEATGGKCEMFVRHKPSECKGMTPKDAKPAPKKKPPRKYGTMMVKAAKAHKDDDDSDMSDNEDEDASMDEGS